MSSLGQSWHIVDAARRGFIASNLDALKRQSKFLFDDAQPSID